MENWSLRPTYGDCYFLASPNKHFANNTSSMNNNADSVNSNSKRTLNDSDTDLELLQIPKRIADILTMPKNQPLIKESSSNQLFTPAGKQSDTSQTSNNENLKQQYNNFTGNQYTVTTNNSFEPLTNNSDIINPTHNKEKLQSMQKNVKIPPITVVGATNFTKAIQIVNSATPNAKYTIKYMSIGTKITVNDIETYTKLKELLNEANVEFFSHDLPSEKFDKFVLSGIAKLPIKDLEEALKTYQLEPAEIREIEQKTKRFDNEGLYVVFFKHGSTKLSTLSKTKINFTIPKWRLFQTSKNNITQCRRCQLYGHGMRNCNMSPKCSNCGLEHLTEKCNSPIQKCANCKGDHQSTSQECPKRKEFIQMRSRLAAANNKTSKPTPAPRKTIENFPKLTKSSNSNPNERNLKQNESSITQWSQLVKNNVNNPVRDNGSNSAKFSVEEIGPIMKDLLTGLKVCRNKEEQLIVMFEIATKYIYNVDP